MSADERSELVGEWAHSFEEDGDRTLVYRRDDYPFPPARRPREALRLEPDGGARVGRVGPADRREWTSGRWGVDGGRLVLDHGDVFDIVALAPDRLELGRPDQPGQGDDR
ncbi:hypothetical protein [Pseudonocardia humida]|uniref:Immunity protein 53 of polymorphic toxin system n=1 Tax=Pseudonocardia humida TaxID=2800819 RepID=A0ABT1A0J6_9PSEU|nr:hypothetical protein [Pseudonocardia humida]MCO1656498.1 hypothetical protein [Pseudonocardia humida]